MEKNPAIFILKMILITIIEYYFTSKDGSKPHNLSNSIVTVANKLREYGRLIRMCSCIAEKSARISPAVKDE